MMKMTRWFAIARVSLVASILLLVSTLEALAQETLHGVVTNQAGKVIELARLVLRSPQDSSIIKEAYTDKDGRYSLPSVKAGRYRLSASKMGHQEVSKPIFLFQGKAMEVDFVLKDEILLAEVEVRSAGITTKGDTTTYSVGHFVSGSERNLGDVLERLPGVSVDKKGGSVSVDGKQVNRILVEENDLFQGNVSAPLEHMSAEGIKNVKVIDNYSEYDIYDGFRSSGETVISVGVKEGMKHRISGDLLTSAGVKGRYKGRNSSMYIGKRSMVSGIVAANNVGERLMNFRDLIGMNGGYSSILSNEDPMEEMQRLLRVYAPFMEGGRDAERKDHGLVSVNTIAHPLPKTKLSVGGLLGLDKLRSREEKSYEYLAPASKYDEETVERTKRYNALVNGKLTLTLSDRLSLIYTGSFFGSEGKERYMNRLMQTPLDYEAKPDALMWRNNLLLVHRLRGKKDNISFSLDYNERRSASSLGLYSQRPLYNPSSGIADKYRYSLRDGERYLSAQVFGLHRLGSRYFVRIGLQSQHTHLSYFSDLDQQPQITSYDTDHYLNVWDTNLNIRFSKDQGSLTYTIGLGGHLMSFRHDVQRPSPRQWQSVLSPSLRLRYAIGMLQYLSFAYDYGMSRYDLFNLTGTPQLSRYNTIGLSSVDAYYARRHRASLAYAVHLPFSGLSLSSMANLERYDKSIASDLSVSGAIREMHYLLDDGVRSVQLVTALEYRLLRIPLNVRFSGTYTDRFAPTYYYGSRYETEARTLQLNLQLSSHYKKGLNARADVSYGWSGYSGLPSPNYLNTLSYRGQVSWQNSKLYTSLTASAEHYLASEDRDHQGYLDAEIRYQLLPKLSLYLQGTDILHLSGRRREAKMLDQYYRLHRTVSQMPGALLVGLAMKY